MSVGRRAGDDAADVEGTKRVSKRSEPDRLRLATTSGRARVVAVLMGAVAVTACGEPEDASLCTAFDEYLDTREELLAAEVSQPSAAGAVEEVEDYLASVHRLQHAADGRYGQQLNDLEFIVNEGLMTLESVQEDADFATWQPLVEEDREMAGDSAAQVVIAIAPSCGIDADSIIGAQSSETSET